MLGLDEHDLPARFSGVTMTVLDALDHSNSRKLDGFHAAAPGSTGGSGVFSAQLYHAAPFA